MTGADIIAAAAVPTPSAAQTAWADTVAAAIDAEVARRLVGYTLTVDQQARVDRAAMIDAIAAFLELKAPHGVLAIGADGDVVRLGRDIARSLEPVFQSIAGPGIG